MKNTENNVIVFYIEKLNKNGSSLDINFDDVNTIIKKLLSINKKEIKKGTTILSIPIKN